MTIELQLESNSLLRLRRTATDIVLKECRKFVRALPRRTAKLLKF
jgi:hypothetical protein